MKFAYRKEQASEPVGDSRTAETAFRRLFRGHMQAHESFAMMMLGQDRVPRCLFRVSSGGLTETVVDLRIVYAAALKTLSTGLIFAHNHPSGNPRPSRADVDLTERLVAAGKLFDIEVLDHLILTANDYYSFKDEGLL